MTEPWVAEHALSDDLARSLVETQFPSLAPTRLERLGVGWDNTAYLANGEWVFRFPRRAIAVELLETERRLLPVLAARLPVAVPAPTLIGRADDRFPWPFTGYRMLEGRTACAARLGDAQRTSAAVPLARFLAALHGVDHREARAIGAPADTMRRLDVAYRAPSVVKRLEQCVRHGLIDDARPWLRLVDATPTSWTPGASTLVHGDFYARHLLVDETGLPVGVIDWGDVHVGDRAADLAIVHGFLPAAAHTLFRDAYGPVDDDTWAIARFRALLYAVKLLAYGHDVGDRDLIREAGVALEYLASPA